MTSGGLDVGRLRLLRAIALRGTIAAAARELGLTPSAVSQQLAVLEREAGARLVDRSPRGVSLTGAGHALAARAGEVLDVLAAARADLDRLGGSLGGPVNVSAVASAALRFVSPAVTALAAEHPDIAVKVTVAEPARAFGLLLAGDADLAVVDEYDYVPLAVPDFMQVQPIYSEAMVAVVSAQWDGPKRPGLADLADADWVMPPEDAACGLAVRSACRASGFEPRVRWVSDDMLVLAAAVAAGHGVAVLPRLSVAGGATDVSRGEGNPGGEFTDAQLTEARLTAAQLTDARGCTILPLRGPRFTRRISCVGRTSVLGRPAVTAVQKALVRSARRR